MEVLHFSDLQKEITEKGFSNPRMTFGFNSLKIVTLPYFNDIGGQLTMWLISFFLCTDATTLFFGILFYAISLYFFYFHFIGLGICQIDFTAKTITIKNRIFILNWLRKLFGMKSVIDFANIKEISYKEGSLLDRFSRSNLANRYLLTIETFLSPAITVCQFKKEEEAQKTVSVLRKFVLNKEKIIA